MNSQQLRSEIDGLALTEKLKLVEDIWDTIAASNTELPLPDWQRQELERRYQSYQAGEQRLHNWHSVHEALRKGGQ
ncbi:addiction module protein [Saccharospirillum mangrovi]|uniref:addiction module protein n=1 Tax=Saccharospirillum mangrovi TaxID=2161747 RepID=UPI000D3963A5|nr:addiction module protein [Saccharospirillum mangrovi]